ncbi:TPA: helix-turn-helix domain-containing protein [Streptococcus suis]|nr:helix-turn-helix domain-containing protein [Streptococcus suis]HEM4904052.1 helix-turn-helix domain-containing protein [Streptococcus suis]
MNKIRDLRTEKNYTQKELADLLGVTSMTISRWEKEEKPAIKHEQAKILANHFGVSVGYLLGYEDNSQLIDDFLKEMSNLSDEEAFKIAKTNDFQEKFSLIKALSKEVELNRTEENRNRMIDEIYALLKGLDTNDLEQLHTLVQRFYFSDYSLEKNSELEYKREKLTLSYREFKNSN